MCTRLCLIRLSVDWAGDVRDGVRVWLAVTGFTMLCQLTILLYIQDYPYMYIVHHHLISGT